MKMFVTLTVLSVIVTLVQCEPPVPQNQYLPPTSRYLPPSQQQQQQPSNNYLPPKSNYGVPAQTSAIFPQQQGGSYGNSNSGGNSGYGRQEEENYGPAKYEFQYDVQDYPTGQDFGHMESRDGDKTVGRYYVLLPDGRKQVVNYEADENGYRPTITYEETNNAGGRGGYNSNAQDINGFGGYDNNAQSKYNNGY